MKNIKIGLIVAIISIPLIFALSGSVIAGPAFPFPIEVMQSDGTIISIQLRGDEWFNWAEDQSGYIIAYDYTSGNWRYAGIENGIIVPSGMKVGVLISPFSFEPRLRFDDIIPLIAQAERISHASFATPYVFDLRTDSPRINQRILLLLIEFNNLQMFESEAFYAHKYFDTTP